MVLFANPLGYSLALIGTFVVGIGLLVGVLVMYIVAQVMAERAENQERREPRG
jgi:phage shock protein PspC (stress-responsive transcriptional regulator)